MAMNAVINAFCQEGPARRGQMTIELMAVLPVAIAISVVAVNALVFFADCAEFDRIARNAVRVHAASPAYGGQDQQRQEEIVSTVEDQVDGEFDQVSVLRESVGGGLVRYTVTLDYAPNLFGMGMRDSILGVSLPRLRHSTSLVIDPYRPGIVFE